ncbi:FG-GAP and VCBS repeat-containing protein [Streptomyces amakusaensis]|uniref:FG-GAP and VCBS repeat-containing protein n=2 Tax=Streptomyces amakusaensis TaxID=67271 RepID=A0ABW0ARM0_9ACTN
MRAPKQKNGTLMRKNLRLGLATATAAALTGGLLGLSTGTATAAAPAKPAQTKPAKPAKYTDDFNGDGYRDYATTEDDDTVRVTYGAKSGIGTRTKTFHQNSPGIPGTRDGEEDMFGEAMATADFNGDGYADLAVSDPTETVASRGLAGLVTIVWGSKSGLGSKATALPLAKPYHDQWFGSHLAAGDFNGDGKPDLAVADSTSVHIYRGGFSSKNGGTGKVTHHKPKGHVVNEPTALIAGKVTKDKATDLYVLGAGEPSRDRSTSGSWFLRGGSTIKAGKPTTYNSREANFAASGVVADFDKDGYGDLAVGDVPYKAGAGSVIVTRGTANGPGSSYRLTQDTPGIATKMSKRDLFGISLSAGDTNRDGYPDLAVGTLENIGSTEWAGGVHILRGGKKGLTGTGSQWITRDTKGIPGKPFEVEMFASDVRLRDDDRDGDADLFVSTDYHAKKSLLLKAGPAGITTGSPRGLRIRTDFPQ